MGFLDLPAELRYSIYKSWFLDRTFESVKCLYPSSNVLSRHLGRSSLSDAFTVCKAITNDPWLTQAILETSLFHLDNARDLQTLLERFTDHGVQKLKQISISGSMATDDMLSKLQTAMPGLKHVHVRGSFQLMSRVCDQRLRKFDRHPWAPLTACLCVFTPDGVPGMDSRLAEQALSDQLVLTVHFSLKDPDAGTRKMSFSTRDWLLRYECDGTQHEIKQVRPSELQSVIDDVKDPSSE